MRSAWTAFRAEVELPELHCHLVDICCLEIVVRIVSLGRDRWCSRAVRSFPLRWLSVLRVAEHWPLIRMARWRIAAVSRSWHAGCTAIVILSWELRTSFVAWGGCCGRIHPWPDGRILLSQHGIAWSVKLGVHVERRVFAATAVRSGLVRRSKAWPCLCGRRRVQIDGWRARSICHRARIHVRVHVHVHVNVHVRVHARLRQSCIAHTTLLRKKVVAVARLRNGAGRVVAIWAPRRSRHTLIAH